MLKMFYSFKNKIKHYIIEMFNCCKKIKKGLQYTVEGSGLGILVVSLLQILKVADITSIIYIPLSVYILIGYTILRFIPLTVKEILAFIEKNNNQEEIIELQTAIVDRMTKFDPNEPVGNEMETKTTYRQPISLA